MRRFSPYVYPFLVRGIVGVGEKAATIGKVPDFGRRKRRRERELEERRSSPSEVSQAADEDAMLKCFQGYGFAQRPLYMDSWVQFLQEIRRIEFKWSLEPTLGGTYRLEVFDHGPDGGSLVDLRGCGSMCQPIADMFECCGALTQGSSSSADVPFYNPSKKQRLQFETLKRIGNISEPPPIIKCLTSSGSKYTSVNISVVDEEKNTTTTLLKEISLLTINNAFLSSIPIFLKRNDIGVRNSDFVTKEQMSHFRFAWVLLRKESWMTPVDIGELDLLLPP